MTEKLTALAIVQKLEAAIVRFQTTGDKSSLKGSLSWAKGAAAKLDSDSPDMVFENIPLDEVDTDEDPKEEEDSSVVTLESEIYFEDPVDEDDES